MLRVGRNAAPWVLYELVVGLDVVDDAWMPQLVPDAWSGAEWPLDALEREDWRGLWGRCGGFVFNGGRGPPPPPRQPPPPSPGARPRHPGGRAGAPRPPGAAPVA